MTTCWVCHVITKCITWSQSMPFDRGVVIWPQKIWAEIVMSLWVQCFNAELHSHDVFSSPTILRGLEKKKNPGPVGRIWATSMKTGTQLHVPFWRLREKNSCLSSHLSQRLRPDNSVPCCHSLFEEKGLRLKSSMWIPRLVHPKPPLITPDTRLMYSKQTPN